ncbi:FG-GAP repeat protein [bacterium]|nr:FG-GAP repeat protein [bacterium]
MRRAPLSLTRCEDRITPSGGLDPAFGTGGVVVTTIAGSNDAAYAVAAQPDGKLVVAGATNAAGPDALLLRYTADGTPDPAFGTGGRVPFGTAALEERWDAVAVQPDGKIVVGGTVGDVSGFDFVVARYNADGTPDTFFGTAGATTIDFGGPADGLKALVVRADGTIVAVGSTNAGGAPRVAVARLQPDGLLDVTFDADGKLIADFGTGTQSSATAAALQADGKLLVAGFVSGGGVNDAVVARLSADGTFDAGFGTAGKAFVDLAGDADYFFSVTAQPDGKVVAAGRRDTTAGGTNGDFAVARLNANGTPDAGFGTAGKVFTNLGGLDGATGVRVQPNGRIVVAGSSSNVAGTTSTFAVVRYTAAGAPDPTFGQSGLVVTSVPGATQAGANAVALQPSGRVVAVGSSNSSGNEITLVGYTANDPPVVTAGGPYTVEAGDDLTLSAAGTSDADGDPLTFAWDLNGDGVFGDVTGPAPVVPWAVLSTLNPQFALNPPAAVQVRVRVGDGVLPPVVSPPTTLTVALAPDVGLVRPVVVGGAPNGSVRRVSPGGTTTVTPFENTGVPTRTASGDVDGDGVADLVAVTGPGTPTRVAVVSGKDGSVLVAPFDPFLGDFPGGGYVAVGDLNGDGRAEFAVTPDEGGGPRVSVFALASGAVVTRANFFGIDDSSFRGGARAAVGDVNGDGTPDVIVAAGFGGGPRTAIFTGQSVLAGRPTRLVADFFAFPGADAENLRNGSFVASGDVTGDGFADLVLGGGPGGAPRVFILSGALVSAGQVDAAQASPVANFFVGGDLDDRGGARVGVTNRDGDGRADVAVGSGAGRPAKVRVYLGRDITGGGEPPATDLDPLGGAVLADGVFVG